MNSLASFSAICGSKLRTSGFFVPQYQQYLNNDILFENLAESVQNNLAKSVQFHLTVTTVIDNYYQIIYFLSLSCSFNTLIRL